jgi:tRNA pseudouridine55 synthase
LGTRKVGHSGTLDPMATGVLVLGVGPATRLLTFLSGVDKDYEATIRFGVETDSLDADGEVVATHDTPVRADAVLAAAADLLGESDQVPPMVSAVKIDGVRLHERARAGEEVERPSRRIRVDRFDPTPTDDPLVWRAAVSCSSGTYVRVLAADLGHAIGSGAHLTALRRTRVGPFTLDEAVPLDDVDPARLLAPSVLARLLPTVEVDESTAVDVGHGKVLERARLLSAAGAGADAGDGPWVVLGPSGDLLAVYQPHRGDRVKPAMVLGRN